MQVQRPLHLFGRAFSEFLKSRLRAAGVGTSGAGARGGGARGGGGAGGGGQQRHGVRRQLESEAVVLLAEHNW